MVVTQKSIRRSKKCTVRHYRQIYVQNRLDAKAAYQKEWHGD